MDRRLKGVVGRGSASWDEWDVGRGSMAEVGRWSWSWLGRGWVMAEVALVMIFFEWVCSGGFQIGWVSNLGWVVVMVCSGRVWVSNQLW